MEKNKYKDNIKQLGLINKYCIYHQDNISSKLGLIKTAIKIRDNNEVEEFKCKLEETMRKWKIYDVFYAINPMIQPIPSGMMLLCSKRKKEFPYNSTSLKIVYDPFYLEDDCLYFIAWTKRVPYTIPLFIYGENENNIYPSFEKLDNISEILELSPIFVLDDPYNNQKDNQPNFIKNNKVTFTFKSYQGRCIPDPNGVSLSKCMVLNNENITDLEHGGKPPTLLQHLLRLEKKRNVNIPLIFEKIPTYLIGIILLIFTIAFFTCIFVIYTKKGTKVYKKNTIKRYGREL
jgi:hypothetical protein